VTLGVTFGAGAVTAVTIQQVSADSDRFRTLDAFAQTLSLVQRNYVEPVDERELIYGSIRGLLAGLDEHSSFYPPRRYERLRQDTQGEFGGIGIRLRRADTGVDPPYPVIEDVIAGSPAARAKVAVGDQLAAIDGAATATAGERKRRGKAFHSVLRGRPGTSIRLDVIDAKDQRRTVSLVRERVVVPSVESENLGDNIGYIKVRKFQEATARHLVRAVRQLPKERLIIDLRNNPGGLFDQAVRIADLFLDHGAIVGVVGRGQVMLERPAASRGRTISRAKIAILVNESTASAAEVLAGALRDNKRALLFGQKTFGKGSVQTFYDLRDGSGIKITTARYVSPSGQVIHGAGLVPDRLVDEFAPEVMVAGRDPVTTSIKGKWPHLKAAVVERLDADYQLLEAFTHLRGEAK
jgi:carboxyl-terminal processing protease